MSEETIVNRVQQTSHFAVEAEKLAPVGTDDRNIAVDLIGSAEDLTPPSVRKRGFNVDPNVQGLYETLVAEKAQTAEAQRTGQVGSIEEPDDNIGNIAEPANMAFAKSLLGLIQVDPGFKKQVIAAFKHLGLDTRKFFSE